MCCRPPSQSARGTYRDASVAAPRPRRTLSLIRCGHAGGEVMEEGRASLRPIHLAWRVAVAQLCMGHKTLVSKLTRSILEDAARHTQQARGANILRSCTVRVVIVDGVSLRFPIFYSTKYFDSSRHVPHTMQPELVDSIRYGVD